MSIEIRKFLFKGMKKPKEGDKMEIICINGDIVLYLNGVRVGSKRTYITLPEKTLRESAERRKRAEDRIAKAKKRQGII